MFVIFRGTPRRFYLEAIYQDPEAIFPCVAWSANVAYALTFESLEDAERFASKHWIDGAVTEIRCE